MTNVMSPSDSKQLTKDLEYLRHNLLNGTIAIEQSLKKIEHRLAYMSQAVETFKGLMGEKSDIAHREEG